MANRYKSRGIFKVRDIVALRIPQEDRVIGDNRFLISLIIEDKYAQYQLPTLHGIINRLYSILSLRHVAVEIQAIEAIELDNSLPNISPRTGVEV